MGPTCQYFLFPPIFILSPISHAVTQEALSRNFPQLPWRRSSVALQAPASRSSTASNSTLRRGRVLPPPALLQRMDGGRAPLVLQRRHDARPPAVARRPAGDHVPFTFTSLVVAAFRAGALQHFQRQRVSSTVVSSSPSTDQKKTVRKSVRESRERTEEHGGSAYLGTRASAFRYVKRHSSLSPCFLC